MTAASRGPLGSERRPWLLLDAWSAAKHGPAAVARRRRARLAELVAYARANSPYYRELYRDLPGRVDDPARLPVIDKKQLMARFDDVATDRAVTLARVRAFVADPNLIGAPFLGRYLVATTSGTTGTPGAFVLDERHLAVNAAMTARLFASLLDGGDVAAILRGGARTAEVVATGGHFAAAAGVARAWRASPRLARRLRLFSVLDPLPELVHQLNAFRPALVLGYTSALAALAEEQRAGRLRIAPAALVATAESLLPGDDERIAAAFGATVGQAYGSTEIGLAAFGCERGWLHVNTDWVVLEPVDADYRPTPPGEPSATVLVSNLANRVQPILRYDLGDRVVQRPNPCPCGNALPAIRVEGRRDDTLRFRDPSGESVPILPLALGTVIEETPGVRRFQALQVGDDELTLRLDGDADADPTAVWHRVRERVERFLAEQGAAGVRLRRAAEPPRRDRRTQKYRTVWDARRGVEGEADRGDR